MKIPTIFAAFGVLLISAKPAASAVSFSFDYSDPSAGFWSSEARGALQDAADRVAYYFSGYTAVIRMGVTGSNEDSPTLASAGSNYVLGPPGFQHLGMVGTTIQSNGLIDQSGGGFHGSVNANFFHQWSFTGTVGQDEYDFIGVMMHEIGHALGFISLIEEDGSSSFAPGVFSPWDQFLVDGAGTAMVDASTLTVNSSAWSAASVGGTGTMPATVGSGLYFSGPNAVAANGGNLVPVYSPDEWEDGSSGSHLDTDFYTDADTKLMNHASPTGPGPREFSELEIAILRDLGYTAIVPEPGTAMMAVLTMGFLMGRRRRVA